MKTILLQATRNRLPLILSVIIMSFAIFLSSCGNNRTELEMQAKAAISKDIKNVTGKCIDGATAGLGSFVMDMALSKKEQDSLILSPVMPYVDAELKTKTEEELKLLSTQGKERIKLISSLLIKNKDAITESVTQKYAAAKSLVDFMIKFIDENKEMVNKLSS